MIKIKFLTLFWVQKKKLSKADKLQWQRERKALSRDLRASRAALHVVSEHGVAAAAEKEAPPTAAHDEAPPSFAGFDLPAPCGGADGVAGGAVPSKFVPIVTGAAPPFGE